MYSKDLDLDLERILLPERVGAYSMVAFQWSDGQRGYIHISTVHRIPNGIRFLHSLPEMHDMDCSVYHIILRPGHPSNLYWHDLDNQDKVNRDWVNRNKVNRRIKNIMRAISDGRKLPQTIKRIGFATNFQIFIREENIPGEVI